MCYGMESLEKGNVLHDVHVKRPIYLLQAERHRFMELYLDQFYAEWNGLR